MGRIKVLNDGLINRIAAGEVVERPASVVKELVENSLDAGASTIHVRLLSGGRRRIQVDDDGAGMDRDDAVLALERHATSKLTDAGQLDAIGTLGFRGEALASIAAVSVFSLRTAPADGEGTEVRVRGGRIESVADGGFPRGSSVAVERLFFNMPARRKFLRTESTELSHVTRWLTKHALARPGVRFRLDQGERTLLNTNAASDRAERIAQIFGRDLAQRLIPFRVQRDGFVVSGFAGRPVETLPGREAQHLFVNERAVQDRVLSHAIGAAYGNTLPRGRYPAIFLFLELEPGGVDVNVHPQKTEVRFRRSSEVHDFVRDAVVSALSSRGVVPSLAELRPGPDGGRSSSIAAATARYLERHETGGRPGGTALECGAPPAGWYDSALLAEPEPSSEPLVETEPEIAALGQYKNSYIVAEDRSGLVLVDQHAAHERVIFERYLAQAAGDEVEVQRLLFPVTVELAPHEQLVLEDEIAEFRRLGFVIEPFGGNTFRIGAVPAMAGEVDPASLLRELLGQAREARTAAADVSGLRRKLVTSAACQAAIKINHPLQMPAMQVLLADLYRTANPTTCPHGRPAIFRLTTDEIERAFRRR